MPCTLGSRRREGPWRFTTDLAITDLSSSAPPTRTIGPGHAKAAQRFFMTTVPRAFPATVRDMDPSTDRLTAMMDVVRARDAGEAERLVRFHSIEAAHAVVDHLLRSRKRSQAFSIPGRSSNSPEPASRRLARCAPTSTR